MIALQNRSLIGTLILISLLFMFATAASESSAAKFSIDYRTLSFDKAYSKSLRANTEYLLFDFENQVLVSVHRKRSGPVYGRFTGTLEDGLEAVFSNSPDVKQTYQYKTPSDDKYIEWKNGLYVSNEYRAVDLETALSVLKKYKRK